MADGEGGLDMRWPVAKLEESYTGALSALTAGPSYSLWKCTPMHAWPRKPRDSQKSVKSLTSIYTLLLCLLFHKLLLPSTPHTDSFIHYYSSNFLYLFFYFPSLDHIGLATGARRGHKE